MLEAACSLVAMDALWRVVAIVGRRFCDREHYTLRMAVETVERILQGSPDPAELNNRWFAAFGSGMYLDHAADAAEEMLDAASQHVEARELADLLRSVLGNPFAGS